MPTTGGVVMATELRICPACETPYDRAPRWRNTRCPQCIGALGGATMRQYGPSRESATRDPEVTVIEELTETMNRLDRAAQSRVLSWFIARYGEAL